MDSNSSGPLSPDGRHQLVDGQWQPVAKPPMTGHQWFQIACVVLVVLVVLGLLFG